MAEVFDVFISYRRSDGNELARALYSYLDGKGLRVFLDEVKLQTGDYFDTQLRDKLISAPHYVLIGTNDAFNYREGEDWVREEALLAVEKHEKAPSERTLTVLVPYDAVLPDKLPGKLDRILKAQRIPMPFGVSNEDTFEKVLKTVTKVSRTNIESAASRWYENSRRPGGRFAHLDICEGIMPRAGKRLEGKMLPINVGVDDRDAETVPLLEAIKQTKGHLFLIGEGGIGKTTALMKLMKDHYEDENTDGPIPVFIELSYAPDNNGKIYESGKSTFIRRSVYQQISERSVETISIFDSLNEADRAYTIRAETAVAPINEQFAKKNDSQEYLLLLDGLNEVSTAKIKGSTDSVIGLIRGEIKYLLEECPNVRVILTSRSDDVCTQYGEVKKLFLSGIDENSIRGFLEAKKVSSERIAIAMTDERLKKTLSIPLFLTMYAELKNKEVGSRGEILRCFFHERSENIGAYTAQSRIAEAGTNFINSETIVENARLTADMQNFILELILPEIGCMMEKEGLFHITAAFVRRLVTRVLKGRADTDLCGFFGDELLKIRSRFGSETDPSEIADAMLKSFGNSMGKITMNVIGCLVNSLGIMQKNHESQEYSFIHQHIRDYFAAVRHIQAMKLARSLQKDGEADPALTVMNELFRKQPVGLDVRRFIGEALGEHYNAPAFENGAWRENTSLGDPDRSLLTQTLDVYRGRKRDEAGYGVYSIVHIIEETRGELSGIDFSGIDFTGCSLNGMRLSRNGLPVKLNDSILSYNELAFLEHTGPIRSAEFSPDGRMIVTASDDGTAKIWDAQSFQLLGTLEGHSSVVNSASFSPDGMRIVTASRDKTAKVWNTQNFSILGTLKGHSDWVNSASFSPDGRNIVTASFDTTAKIWDAESFSVLGTLKEHGSFVNSASFSPDGEKIVTASRNVNVWDAKDLKLLGTLKGHSKAFNSAAFSPVPGDNRIVTASDDGTARIWDAESFQLLGTLRGHPDLVASAAFSPDGNRVLTAGDLTARVWDAQRFSVIGIIDGAPNSVNSAAFSPDGSRIVTASGNKTAKVWDTHSFSLLGTLKGHSNEVNTAVFNSNGDRIATASSDGTAKVWHTEGSPATVTLKGYSMPAWSAAFSPDGSRIVTISQDNTVRIWTGEDFVLLGTLKEHSDKVWSAVFSPSGDRIVTASWDNTAKVWESKDFTLLGTLTGHYFAINAASFNPDESRIVTASWDGTAKVWDAHNFSVIYTLAGHSGSVCSASFSLNNNRIVTASMDETAKVWDADHFSLLGVLRGHDDAVNAASFNHNGNRIVTASGDKTAKIWDAASFTLIGTLEGHAGSVNAASFSPDGSTIITASSDGTIKLWDAESLECLLTIPNVPGLNLVGVDLTRLAPGCGFTEEQKELLRIYGAKI